MCSASDLHIPFQNTTPWRRGRWRSDMKELHMDSGCAGLLCGVTGQRYASLLLWGALVSGVSWKPFSRVEMWR